MNQLTITGYVTADPNTQFTPSGEQVTNFGVAVNKRWNTDKGMQEETTFFQIAAWRRLAETTAQYLRKGSRVLVVGEVKTPRIFAKRDGTAGASLDVVAHSVEFLSPREDATTPAPAAGPPPADDEDIPF